MVKKLDTWYFNFFEKVFTKNIYIHIYIYIHVSKYLLNNYHVKNNSIKIYNQNMYSIYISNMWKKHTSILYNNMWVSIYYIASMWILQLYKEKHHEMKREGWKNSTLLSSTIFSFCVHAKRMTKRKLLVPNLLGTMYAYGMFKDSRKWALNTNPQTTSILRKRLKKKGL